VPVRDREAEGSNPSPPTKIQIQMSTATFHKGGGAWKLIGSTARWGAGKELTV